ncbi:hypothetical protein FVA81_21185 [Rhizobium sp. WL3]|uniref:hypothetical protein n=1 Tax=Rhizobium sp. WL3 TaxID=2603277 RepID=UPI0011C1EE34|nr:hypothetical protein [Rhizobium sp. WL3]QEE46967.1 hypothetical protein FVA81_21185 [Rhizobium sp. WL3]
MLQAATRLERRTPTSFVLDTVNRFGGWIGDVRVYSNKMNTVRRTLPAGAFVRPIQHRSSAAS